VAVWAIGDVQGCYDELCALLERIVFDAGRDRLWFVGDLVNRGPQSLEVLRFVRGLGDRAVAVLGNHDLHLLAAAAGTRRPNPKDTFDEILAAPDRDALVDWLRRRPLLHADDELGVVMIHAGLAPQWNSARARACAAEVEAVLRADDYREFLAAMYGDRPDRWSDDLRGIDRLRFSLNCFTRLRLCDRDGRLHLREKGSPWNRSNGLVPWFAAPGRASAGADLVFGHWSMLGRYEDRANGVYALDSGCIWGGALTALRLDGDSREWKDVPCAAHCRPGDLGSE
jgi:bis(5'-nucleosyl)-tetraphosphatase (symmetrical)